MMVKSLPSLCTDELNYISLILCREVDRSLAVRGNVSPVDLDRILSPGLHNVLCPGDLLLRVGQDGGH